MRRTFGCPARVLVLGIMILLSGGCGRETSEGPATGPAAEPAASIAESRRLPPPKVFGWRGDGTGSFPETDPPTQWDADEDKGIIWETKVGASYSSPVVVGDRIFVAAEKDKLLCVDRRNGSVLWEKNNGFAELPEDLKVKEKRPPSDCGFSTPTPVTDGRHIWAVFGTGIVVCYDLDGSRRWVRHFDIPPATEYGRSASPVLVGDKLLLTLGHLLAVDPSTGKLLWEAKEAMAGYGTPAVAKIGDVDVAITPFGSCVRLSDGRMLTEDVSSLDYNSPIVHEGKVYFVGQVAKAVGLREKGGDAIECKTLWEVELEGEFYASPVYHEGTLYVASNEGKLYALNAKTGETVFGKQLDIPSAAGMMGMEPANIYPSLAVAGGSIFVGNATGDMLVLQPGTECKEVSRNILDDGSAACPVFDGRDLFLRGADMLYKIGRK